MNWSAIAKIYTTKVFCCQRFLPCGTTQFLEVALKTIKLPLKSIAQQYFCISYTSLRLSERLHLKFFLNLIAPQEPGDLERAICLEYAASSRQNATNIIKPDILLKLA